MSTPQPFIAIDRENAFMLYATFTGDLVRTAASLGVRPMDVLRVAQEEEWDEKLKPILELAKSAKQKKKETRRTVRGDMYSLFADVMTALQGISESLQRLEQRRILKSSPPVELFKRDRLVVDIDTMKDFTVNVPHPTKAGEVLEKILIQVPVRRDNGEDIIQPEGLALIEQTKRHYLDIFSDQPQPKEQIVYES